jgi:hypothetical protein
VAALIFRLLRPRLRHGDEAAPHHAQAARWRSEIQFSEKLPAAIKTKLWCRRARNVPIVNSGAAEPAIAAAHQFAMQLGLQQQILDKNQPRLPVAEVEAVQYVQLMSFHVDRDAVDGRGVGLRQYVIERPDRDLDEATRLDFRQIEPGIEGRVAAGKTTRRARQAYCAMDR